MQTTAWYRMVATLVLTSTCALGQNDPNRKDWIQAFNGKNLDGWIMKIAGFPLGENYGNTFRVENGLLKAAYDQYPEFGNRFGHLFYRTKFSHISLPRNIASWASRPRALPRGRCAITAS
jgi:hypothetical protein